MAEEAISHRRQLGFNTGGAGAVTAAAATGDRLVHTNPRSYLKNSIHVSYVATLLSLHISGKLTDPLEFSQLCLALARGIDHAVANNEVPPRVQELPMVLKQVCHRKSIFNIQPVIAVLMASVKGACKNGWFLCEDKEELLTLANEIVSGFCSLDDMNIEPSSAFSTISKMTCKFYPQLKIGHILASLEVKPGYGAYVVDFNVPKSMDSTAKVTVSLFVARTDCMETSSCIVSPPLVNFLLNGKGVARRINVSMDNGPQIPTNVTHMLKVGTNLLQVIGQFNENCVIVIAFTSVISSLGRPVLQDYVQPVAAVDSDSDIIEGASRISLNCPISHTRIRTPVKGHLCKHHQCFDYDNFLEINFRRPSWRCAHCDQSVCYTDIRIDQNMVKVLKEVAESVSDVFISVDGSWKAAGKGNDQGYQLPSCTLSCENDDPEQHEFSKDPVYVMDLTGEDDEGYTENLCETEDRKPFQDNNHGYSMPANLTLPPEVNTPTEMVVNSAAQTVDDCSGRLLNSVPRIEDDFWERIFLSTSGATLRQAAHSSSMVDACVAGGITVSSPTNFVPSPVLTDAISPSLNREAAGAQGSSQPILSVQLDQFSSPSMQLQPSQFGNSISSSGTGRPAIPRTINRIPVAIQALPAQAQVPNLNQQVRSNMNPLLPNGFPLPQCVTATDGFNVVGGEMERHQQSSRLLMNPLATSDIALMQHPSMVQSWGQKRQRVSTQSPPLGVGLAATSENAGYFRSSSQPTQQRPPSWRSAQTMNLPSNLVPQSSHFPSMPSAQVGGQQMHPPFVNFPPSHPPPAFRIQQVPVQLPRAGSSPSMVMGEQRGGNMVQPASRSDVSGEFPSEQNWHPTGRMRGSLTGPAYSAALSQYMGQLTSSAPLSRTMNSQSPTLSGPSQLQSGGLNTQSSQQAYLRMVEAINRPGRLGALPGQFRGTL